MYDLIRSITHQYNLGQIQRCYRAPRTNSLNFFVTTTQGKFVFRRHNLSEAAVAYEYEILAYLKKQAFPAPRMLTNRTGQAWVTVGDTRYSVYEFVTGYSPTDYVWGPVARRNLLKQCGRALGKYHHAVVDLQPIGFKWSGYQPKDAKRWREGDWFRQALIEVDAHLQRASGNDPIDDFTRQRTKSLREMLDLEPLIETNGELSKLVIHGDYAPWNVLFGPDHRLFIIDFNESRLDLKIYDILLATFWFAWRGDHLDPHRAGALQSGYCQTNCFNPSDLQLASQVFQWIMARSMVERLYHHYSGYRRIHKGAEMLENQYRMCQFAQLQPQQLITGLKDEITRDNV